MSISIRSARRDEIPEVHQLISEFAAFIKTPEKVSITTEQLQQDLENELYQCLVAIENDHIVGYATLCFTYYTWTGKSLYLDDLYIREAYRGHGIGSLFMNAIFDLARSTSCKKVKWQVSRWNDSAINFYRQLGAAIDDTEMNCDLLLRS